jgi:hypothetical protein
VSHFIRNWRVYAKAASIVVAELVLAGAAEGPQKLQFIGYGTAAITLVAITFRFL